MTLLRARLWWKLHRRVRVWVWLTVALILGRPVPELTAILSAVSGLALLSDYLFWRLNW